MGKTINIKESLLRLDKSTDFAYDLLTAYEASDMGIKEKKKLAEMLSKNKKAEAVSKFLAESIGHMKDDHTFAPLSTATALEVGQKVYKPNSDEIWTVKSIDPKNWSVDIVFEDENGNEIHRSAGMNSLWELVGENDTSFEVDDDWDIEWYPISNYFNNDLDEDVSTSSADFIVDVYEVDPDDDDFKPIGEPTKVEVNVDDIIKEYSQQAYDYATKEMTSDYIDSEDFRYSSLARLIGNVASRKFWKEHRGVQHMPAKITLVNRKLFLSSIEHLQKKLGSILLPRYSKKRANEGIDDERSNPYDDVYRAGYKKGDKITFNGKQWTVSDFFVDASSGKYIPMIRMYDKNDYFIRVPVSDIKRKSVQKARGIDEAKTIINFTDEMNDALSKCDKIVFYETPTNSCPVKDFLLSLKSQQLLEKTVFNIERLNNLGRDAKKPLVAHVGEGIMELRTEGKDGWTRIFYFFPYADKYVLTNGYQKQKNKMDSNEFAKAKKYRDDFLKNITKAGNK